MAEVLRACVIAKSESTTEAPWAGSQTMSIARPPRPTHAAHRRTHGNRRSVLAGGAPNSIRNAARFML
jgi:hypothetical protein